MPTQLEKALAFRALHNRPGAFVIPNPWDAGSTLLLNAFGFEAMATTSAGLAFALGLRNGVTGRAVTLANARAIVEATDLPVSADLENWRGRLWAPSRGRRGRCASRAPSRSPPGPFRLRRSSGRCAQIAHSHGTKSPS